LIDLQLMNRIKEVLKEKRLTQTWLSTELGKSYNMVNSYVQNRSQPSIELLYEIATLLKVDARDLLVPKNTQIKSK
jgi:putative transcriptional regulator